MRMSRPTTLLHLLLGLRTSTSTTISPLLNKSPVSPLLFYSTQCHATNLYPHPALYQSTSANLAKTYSTSTSTSPSTMSTSQPTNTQNPQPQSKSESQSKPLLALPDTNSATHQLNVNGDGVKLDHLGPLIVNADGTLSRIGNWAQMTEIEQRNTLRVLGKRNKERMERLKAANADGGLEEKE
ncbi:hypothetical protein BDV12DRAFT_48045 [Aspergillus spectabilis]